MASRTKWSLKIYQIGEISLANDTFKLPTFAFPVIMCQCGFCLYKMISRIEKEIYYVKVATIV